MSEAGRNAGIPLLIVADLEDDRENGDLNPMPAKSQKTSLFASYERRPQLGRDRGCTPLSSKIAQYLAMLHNTTDSWNVARHVTFHCLTPLFEKVFCTPCTSVPVEHIFSKGGLFMRPH